MHSYVHENLPHKYFEHIVSHYINLRCIHLVGGLAGFSGFAGGLPGLVMAPLD